MISRNRAAAVLLALLMPSHSLLAQESISTAPLNSVERHALNPPREMLDHGKNVAATAHKALAPNRGFPTWRASAWYTFTVFCRATGIATGTATR